MAANQTLPEAAEGPRTDLSSAVARAVEQGQIEIESLHSDVITLLDGLQRRAGAMRSWDSRPDSSTQGFISLSDDLVGEMDDLFRRQRDVLKTFNIAFFGRTGAGKSTLLSAFGELDGRRVSPGESDWTTDVEPILWHGCALYDTPGINGWGRTRSRADLETRARRAVETADVVILCFDSQSQQVMEFEKVATWVRDYGKPAVAVLNVRNPVWRHPARVPSQAARRNLSESVRQHRDNIRGELGKIGLTDTPVVALHSHRALMARATEPYAGPDKRNLEGNREEFGLDYLVRWSNFRAVEALLSTMIETGGSDLRMSALRDGIRSSLAEWKAAIRRLAKQARQDARVVERSIGEYLDVLGYPDNQRAEYLWEDRVTGDLLTLNETARREPYSSAVKGRLDRHVRHLLKAHLSKARSRSLRKSEDLILEAFSDSKPVSEKRFRRRVFDDDAVDDAVATVWMAAGDFLTRELGLAVAEGSTDTSFLSQGRVDVAGNAGKGMRYASNSLKAGGLLAGGAGAALAIAAALNFWNPGGWAAALALAGLGIASGISKWFGGRARRKAEKQKVQARSRAIGGARRAVNDYYDNLESELASQFARAAWDASGASLRALLWESTTLRRTSDELRQVTAALSDHIRNVPESPSASTVMSHAQVLVLEASAAESSPDRVWLGEDWIEAADRTHPVRHDSAEAFDGQERNDACRLQRSFQEMWRWPAPQDIAEWMGDLAGAAQEDVCVRAVQAACASHQARVEPRVVMIGDFSAGKSSLIKRILAERGRTVPESLNVRADPTTDASAEYPMDRLTLVDTPGFQSGRDGHDAEALAAAVGAVLVVFVFHVNLVIGDPELLEKVVMGSPVQTGKQDRTLFLINRCDELGVDPELEPLEFLGRRRRKEIELRMALGSRGIDVAPDRIHSISGDPFGLVGGRPAVTSEDYVDDFRRWDGVRPLLEAMVAVREELVHHGIPQAALDVGITGLLNLSQEVDKQICALDLEISRRGSILTTLANALAESEILQRSLHHEAEAIIASHANGVLSDAMGAGPNEIDALADRLANWWADEPLVAELERYLRSSANRIDDWYNSFASTLDREFRSVRMLASLPEFDGVFESGEMRPGRRSARAAAEVTGQTAKVAEAVGSRDAVYAIGKSLGYKFKPWGAVKGGARVARVGAVLAVVAVALDVGAWVIDARAEKGRERARNEAAGFIRDSVREAVTLVTCGADGDGPLSYLEEIQKQVHGFSEQMAATQGDSLEEHGALNSRLTRIRDLIRSGEALRTSPTGGADHA